MAAIPVNGIITYRATSLTYDHTFSLRGWKNDVHDSQFSFSVSFATFIVVLNPFGLNFRFAG